VLPLSMRHAVSDIWLFIPPNLCSWDCGLFAAALYIDSLTLRDSNISPSQLLETQTRFLMVSATIRRSPHLRRPSGIDRDNALLSDDRIHDTMTQVLDTRPANQPGSWKSERTLELSGIEYPPRPTYVEPCLAGT
jgi:hypothetical protein